MVLGWALPKNGGLLDQVGVSACPLFIGYRLYSMGSPV